MSGTRAVLSCRRGLATGLGFVVIAGLCACSGSNDPSAALAPGSTSTQQPPPPAPRPPFEVGTPPLAQITCSPCTRLAFTSSRDGNPEIYTVRADGTELRRLTDSAASDDNAVWSPDGQRIAFTRRVGDDSQLMVMNADGTRVVRHTLPHSAWAPAWSPDGSRITYSAVSDGSANIFMVDADGGWPVLLFSRRGWESHPSWSPDGTKLALVSDWFAYDGVFDVFLIDPDGAGFAPVTDGNIFDRLDYLWPSWSPDGTRIALTLSSEVGRDRYSTYVGVISRDGTGLTPLMAAAPWSKSSWSPDGTMIAFTSESAAGYDVSWVKADGSAWGTIVTDGWNAAWQR